MKKILILVLPLHLLIGQIFAQQENKDSVQNMENIIISFNKWEQKLNEVPNKIVSLDMGEARLRNPQTSADLLGMSGGVFIQKSQLGGGSPIIRGFATNRVLIVSDGVRMNNAIYRSGNLQNVISIDALAIEDAEVIFGPGSLIYGSDAIGGVMDFHSLKPRYSSGGKMFSKGSALARYSTASGEKTVHADLNLGWKKLSILSSVTYSKFNDLKMGEHTGPDSYLRPEYVQRINGIDSIVKNSDPRVQRFTGYEQWNILQKLAYKFNDRLELQYGFTYGGTGDAPRYDRLIQYRQGKLRFAEWYYGPMIWRMHQLQLNDKNRTRIYDESRLIIAYQDYDESRIDRTRGNNFRQIQSETVKAYSLNWDALKTLNKGELYYGLEALHNRVVSFGAQTNITNGNILPFVSRYPDGSTVGAAGMYASYKLNISEKITITTGLRFSYNMLDASFDTSFIKFPYDNIRLREAAPTGNFGLVYRPAPTWQINANISTGFRMPNIDDIGKFFESVPGSITVPNPDLASEYAWNFEVGAAKRVAQKLNLEFAVFYTLLNNAIVRRPYSFNGQDSIDFGGITSQVEALQNVAKANVWGFQAVAEIYLTRKLIWQINANFMKGKETDEEKDEDVPLRHAPPYFGNTNLRYTYKRFTAEFSAFYNAEIKNEDLAPSEQAKTDIYAKDENGNPYSPSWYSLNMKCSLKITDHLSANIGWENMTNQRYRSYSSGIVAPASNFIFSVRATL
jgi:hemoglobin/transferrin/lactoferrin receptor protein